MTAVLTQAFRLDLTLVIILVRTRRTCIKVGSRVPARVTVPALQHGWVGRHVYEYACDLCTRMRVCKEHGIWAYVNVLAGVSLHPVFLPPPCRVQPGLCPSPPASQGLLQGAL